MNVKIASSCVGLIVLLSCGSAEARGCVSGAAVGAVAGHVAGHHAVIGAVAGCAVNHHRNKVIDERARAAQTTQSGAVPPAPASTTPPR